MDIGLLIANILWPLCSLGLPEIVTGLHMGSGIEGFELCSNDTNHDALGLCKLS